MIFPDWLQIAATSAIGAGVVSSWLNWVFNKDIKTIEYKNTILKELFAERIKALKEFRETINLFKGNIIVVIDNEQELVPEIIFNAKDFNSAFEKLQEINEHALWLSPETNAEYLKFCRLMRMVAEDVNKSKNKEAVARVGAKYHDMIVIQLSILIYEIEKDFLSQFDMKKVLARHEKSHPSILLKNSTYDVRQIVKEIDEKIERGDD